VGRRRRREGGEPEPGRRPDRRHRPVECRGRRDQRAERHPLRGRGRQRRRRLDGRRARLSPGRADCRRRRPGRPARRLLQPRPAPRRSGRQAGDHRTGRRHRRGPRGRHHDGRPGGRALHRRLRHVDGHAARRRGGGGPRPAASRLDRAAAQERADQHGQDQRRDRRLRPGRRPRRSGPCRDPASGRHRGGRLWPAHRGRAGRDENADLHQRRRRAGHPDAGRARGGARQCRHGHRCGRREQGRPGRLRPERQARAAGSPPRRPAMSRSPPPSAGPSTGRNTPSPYGRWTARAGRPRCPR